MKAYPAYKDSGIEWLGEIPAGWEVKKVKHLLNILTDYSANGSFADLAKNVTYLATPGYSRLIRLTDLRVDLENEGVYVDEHAHLFLKKSELFGGEILIANVGAYAGHVCRVPLIDFKATLGPNMYLLRFSEGIINDDFVFYVLISTYCQQQLQIKATSTAQPKLNKDDVKDITTIAPPLPEQRAIAAFLDHKTRLIDTYVAKKQQQIERLQAYRTALINQAVTKGLNPDTQMKDSGIEWLGEIPAHWELVKLKFLTTKIGSGVTPRGGSTVYQQTGIPLLRSQNIHFDGLKLDEVAYISHEIHDSMSNTKVQPNDVLLNITGASIGRCYYVDKNLGEANVNQHVCIIRPNSEIETKFLFNMLASQVGQFQVFCSQIGTSREGLNFEQLKNFIIPLPPQKEQLELIRFLDRNNDKIFLLVSELKNQIDRLQAYRTALISDAVTGKIDVRTDNYKDYT